MAPGKVSTFHPAAAPGAPKLVVRDRGALHVIDPAEITRISAQDKYAVFEHRGREFLLDASLTELAEKLCAVPFIRVHRAELVNLHCIREVRFASSHAAVELRDGQCVPVSRRQVRVLKQRLGMTAGRSSAASDRSSEAVHAKRKLDVNEQEVNR